MCRALFISKTSTGSSPLYSRLTGLTTVLINDDSFCIDEMPINHLDEELNALKKLCALTHEYELILYNDEKEIPYLSECCRQYGLEFSPVSSDYLYNHIDKLKPDIPSIKENIPVINGELKHFYKDYKNYYYLPAEDVAYHKSVSSFVDRSARIQATASTAYTKRTGDFVPVPKGVDINPDYLFRKSYEDKAEYIPLEHLDLSDSRVLCSYIFCPHILPDA